MKLSELKANPKNPRKISPEKLEMLKRSLLEFGDLGGIILNRRTGQLVGGHQRRDALEEGSVIITQVFTEATATGTVAEGYVEIGSDRFNYREVDWDETREMAANIAANKGAGEWDMTKLSEMMNELSNLNFNLDLTMFDENERGELKIDFGAGTEDEQGKLDEKEMQYLECPHCKEQFEKGQARVIKD